MKLYTRTGDKGQTSVIGGRVDKDDAQVEAYGTVDELNSFVGQAAAMADSTREADLLQDLYQIQQELFDCGSDLAFVDNGQYPYKVGTEPVIRLENWIDRYTKEPPPIERFILPGGSPLSAALHVCRTVCRRAERRIVTLARIQPVNEQVAIYINRLSDLFFVMARVANVRASTPDVAYERSANVFRNDRK